MRNYFFAFILLFLGCFVLNINAATYVVDRADDVTATACTAAANDYSLRGAIINANANGADFNADVLMSSFQDGTINILAPSAANVLISGKVSDKTGRGIGETIVTLTDSNGET